MVTSTALEAPLSVLTGARIQVGSTAIIDAANDLVLGARSRVTSEMFKITDADSGTVLRQVGQRIPVAMHGDTAYIATPGSYLIDGARGVTVTGHGAPPVKLHTKTLIADGERGIVMTASLDAKLRAIDAVDFAAHVTGNDAVMLERLARSAVSGVTRTIRTEARRATQRGVYLEDSSHGVHELSTHLERALRADHQSIYAASKIVNDPAIVRLLAAARERGTHVLVETSETTLEDHALLDQLHVPVTQLGGRQRKLHGTLVLFDHGTARQQAVMGTFTLSPRGMGRDYARLQLPTSMLDYGVQSRELGFVTEDAQGIEQAIDAVQSVRLSQARAFTDSVG